MSYKPTVCTFARNPFSSSILPYSRDGPGLQLSLQVIDLLHANSLLPIYTPNTPTMLLLICLIPLYNASLAQLLTALVNCLFAGIKGWEIHRQCNHTQHFLLTWHPAPFFCIVQHSAQSTHKSTHNDVNSTSQALGILNYSLGVEVYTQTT